MGRGVVGACRLRSVLTSSTNLGHCAPSTMNITGTEIRKASTCSEGKGGGGWVHVGAEGVEGWGREGAATERARRRWRWRWVGGGWRVACASVSANWLATPPMRSLRPLTSMSFLFSEPLKAAKMLPIMPKMSAVSSNLSA